MPIWYFMSTFTYFKETSTLTSLVGKYSIFLDLLVLCVSLGISLTNLT
jgi:hypothetical protein